MSLRKFNNILSIIVILLGLYISMSPFLPQIAFKFRDRSPEKSAPYAGELAKDVGSSASADAPKENRIVIPSIQLNEPIKESSNIGVISRGGTWHRPQTSTPDQIGNTVIVGHRFYGSNVSTFYHLDKVLPGQKLAIYWEGKEFLYEVSEVRVVDPTAIDVEAQTTSAQLTLYTCTPIWTAKQRLVVIAKPVEQGVNR